MKHKKLILSIILLFGLGLMRLQAQTPNVKDYDGNVYKTVTISKQIWIVENLKTTHYNDGEIIPLVEDSTAWSDQNSPGYCWYKNDRSHYENIYGALYKWYTVETGKLCPSGWHVPTEADWTTLVDFSGGEKVAASKLKETGKTHWTDTSPGTTNSTGFTALPGGIRISYGGFNFIGSHGAWWSAQENSLGNAWLHSMIYIGNDVFKVEYDKTSGVSVRCVKN
jgi:uncharacterized protein (TIGR02145 family)